jgi:GNAT superfamily N-acetyltransferase
MASRQFVRVLQPADGPAAAACLGRGFDQEPAKVALIPDGGARRIVTEMSAANQLHAALRRGAAYAALVDHELAAVAVWCPPGQGKVSVTGALRAVLAVLVTSRALTPAVPGIFSVLRSDAAGAFALVRRRRQAVVRASRGLAWNLLLIATVPEHRGKGLARMLLDRQLRRCDEDGVPVWLETTNPINPPIYERFGFVTVAHIDGPAWLPGLWVMRREPSPWPPSGSATA